MRSILKQTTWLILSQVLTKIIGFFYTIFLARILGVSDFGLFTVAIAYFSIISSISDFGFNRFLIREIATDKLKAPELLWNICMLRLTLTSVIFAIFSITLYILDPDKVRVSLILLSVLAILPQSIALTFDGIFTALQKLQFSAISIFVSSLLTATAGFYLVGKGFGPMGAVNALIFGEVIYVVVLGYFLYKNKMLSLSKISTKILKQTLIGSLPYGLLGVLGLLYFRIDAIILSYLRGSFETGLYGVAYKALEAVIFIPGSFSAALFPEFVKLQSNVSEMKKVYFKSLRFMTILGIVIGLGYLFILPLFISTFLPQFLQAIPAIRILAFSIPFIFMSAPGVQVMLSTDKYLKPVIGFSILTVIFNIILNLIFIPQFGFLATSWVTVASDVLSFAIFFQLTKKVMLNRSIQ